MTTDTEIDKSPQPQDAAQADGSGDTAATGTNAMTPGTILEAAFVDPAYSWPPAEGMGKNAIELLASTALIKKVRDSKDASQEAAPDEVRSVTSDVTTASEKAAMTIPDPPKFDEDPAREEGTSDEKAASTATGAKITTTTVTTETKRGFGVFRCCRSNEAVVNTSYEDSPLPETPKSVNSMTPEERSAILAEYEVKKQAALEAREKHKAKKKERRAARDKARKAKEKYGKVPEGILIYRLDTSDHTITLLSSPNSNTDLDTLLRRIIVADATPSSDKSRRGINLIGVDGTRATLVACEQRTAIAWLEAIGMMLGNEGRGGHGTGAGVGAETWAAQELTVKERDQIEEQYLNLAAYSNKLIRAGAIPGQKKDKKSKQGVTGNIYYNIETKREDGEEYDEETLESIAKRRAVIKDSWDFYRMICSLLRDRRKHDEVFRKMQLDPVYPYLNSMTGLNDPGDDGFENADKVVMQKDLPEYADMSRTQVCQDLVNKAEEALPSLVEICKALAGSLGMEEVGVGPIKEVSAAIRKAEKKYEGDVLKVTDYCRALLVVKDFPTLLALLELARDSFGPLIRRVKLSTLKSDHKALSGGYRDCKINLELKGHVCEIQVHLWPMWVVCGVDGFRHYRHCLEYSTDTFTDPYDALSGLDRKTMAELIVMAEEAVSDMPLDSLEWYHEKFILDYFAEAGLFLKHGLFVWAEITLRQLVKLRCESPDIGPDHHETLHLQNYLERCLRQQGKFEEADEIAHKLEEAEKEKKAEKKEAEKSLWDTITCASAETLEMLMDPSKKEREEEERLRKEVKASKKQWRKIRSERFKFLDANAEAQVESPTGTNPQQ